MGGLFDTATTTLNDASAVSHLVTFALAAGLGYLISLLYRKTHTKFVEATFSDTLILLCLLISIVMVVIGDSVARAFSLVGALSIIRFRTAVKDPRDIAFVFFALAVGMAVGAGRPGIAALGTVIVTLVVVAIHLSRLARPHGDVFRLSFAALTPATGTPGYDAVLCEHVSAKRRVAEKLSRAGGVRVTYRIRLKRPGRWLDLAHALSSRDDVADVEMKRQ